MAANDSFADLTPYTARLALWLRCVNAILAGELPAASIPGSTMQKAVHLASFYLGQAKLVYAVNSPQSGLTGRLLKLYQFAEGKKKGITPRLVKTNMNCFKKIPTAEILRDCQSLAKDGYFRSSGGTFFVGDVGGVVGGVGDLLVAPPTPETSINQGFYKIVGDVGDVGDFEKSTNTLVPPYRNEAQEVCSTLDQPTTTNNNTNKISAPLVDVGVDTVGDIPPTVSTVPTTPTTSLKKAMGKQQIKWS